MTQVTEHKINVTEYLFLNYSVFEDVLSVFEHFFVFFELYRQDGIFDRFPMKSHNAAILIIDDDEDVLFSGKMLLKDYFKKVQTISEPASIPYHIASGQFDLVLLDMNYSGSETSGREGLRWLREIRQLDPSVVVVMMTAFASLDLAVQAIKEGATDFVVKPWQNHKLLATLSSAYELRKARQETETLKATQKIFFEESDKAFGELVGRSACMQELYSVIEKTAATDANILILGENGTGKELVARSIHKRSLRAGKNLISVDLGAVNENLFESELFGHVKGAFTDARENRPGRFEIASGGTLFLDEIGNIPLTLQAKLLSAIQNREVTRVGANRPVSVDLRLICATNAPIYEKVEAGTFREDLLYRIKTIEIQVPPLRERMGDIPLLVGHFLSTYCKKYRKPMMKLSKEARKKMEGYSWPGNVRELQHVLERAVIMSNARLLKTGDFPLKEPLKKQGALVTLQDLNIATIREMLGKHGGNLSKAARELGITRAALYRRIEKYDIHY
jgi:two-component system response regulator HydG